jgi:hypothetical protein
MENVMYNFMAEYIKLSYLNKNRYWAVFEGSKHGDETRITEKNGGPNKCESLYLSPEKLTHFKMR